MEGSFHVNSLFIGTNVRAAVQEGRADFTPVFLHEIPRLFREGYLPIDVALISVSPPDQHGFCSYGVEVGVTKPAVESARVVIAEINPNMHPGWCLWQTLRTWARTPLRFRWTPVPRPSLQTQRSRLSPITPARQG